MEYMSGSIFDRLHVSKTNFLSEQQICKITYYILLVLDYLHKKNIIHRDIKSSNILLSNDGQIKISDLGVSKSLARKGYIMKQTHSMVGTPYWMAPELLKMDGYNYKVDIWSLGITVIEMSTKHPPKYKQKPMKAMISIINDPPPKIIQSSRCSKNMIDFVSKCLTIDSNKRPTAQKLLKHQFFKNIKKTLKS